MVVYLVVTRVEKMVAMTVEPLAVQKDDRMAVWKAEYLVEQWVVELVVVMVAKLADTLVEH